MIKKAVIISSQLVQDQEFVYPYYRLLEDEFEIEIDDEELTDVGTVGQAVNLLHSKL